MIPAPRASANREFGRFLLSFETIFSNNVLTFIQITE